MKLLIVSRFDWRFTTYSRQCAQTFVSVWANQELQTIKYSGEFKNYKQDWILNSSTKYSGSKYTTVVIKESSMKKHNSRPHLNQLK